MAANNKTVQNRSRSNGTGNTRKTTSGKSSAAKNNSGKNTATISMTFLTKTVHGITIPNSALYPYRRMSCAIILRSLIPSVFPQILLTAERQSVCLRKALMRFCL